MPSRPDVDAEPDAGGSGGVGSGGVGSVRPDRSDGGAVDPRIVRSRRAVLDACVELMVERGVPAVTVDAIAERSGVAKSTLYRHWATREAVIADAWRSFGDQQPPELPGDLRGDLLALTEAVARRLARRPFSVLLPDLVAAAERDPEVRELHHTLMGQRRRLLADRFERAVDEGELPADVDVALLTSMLVGPVVLRGVVLREAITPSFLDGLVAAVLRAAGSA